MITTLVQSVSKEGGTQDAHDGPVSKSEDEYLLCMWATIGNA